MPIVPGKYEFLKETHISLDTAQFSEKSGTTAGPLEVIVSGDKISLNSVQCQVGKEFKDKMPNGVVLDSTPSIDDSKLIIKSNKEGTYFGERVYEFLLDGVIVTETYINSKVIVKRFYKK